MTNPDAKTAKTAKAKPEKPLQGVVVPTDNRTSAERVQDLCFEELIRAYTKRQDWDFLTLLNAVYGKILTDRHADDETIQTTVQSADSDPKELL